MLYATEQYQIPKEPWDLFTVSELIATSQTITSDVTLICLP